MDASIEQEQQQKQDLGPDAKEMLSGIPNMRSDATGSSIIAVPAHDDMEKDILGTVSANKSMISGSASLCPSEVPNEQTIVSFDKDDRKNPYDWKQAKK